MTIDFGNNHFNAIYLNDQLKLIASDGRIITINESIEFFLALEIPGERLSKDN